jgi:hypothetical protein
VICQGKSGLFAVRAATVVDCSGDGDVCAWAGAPFAKGDELGRMQPGTLVSMWAGIDWEKAYEGGTGLWAQSQRLREAIADGLFTVPDPGMPGIVPTGSNSGNGNVGHLFGVDGCDERSLTRAAMESRQRMAEYTRYFREYLTGYENLHLNGTASRVGIRETRRIAGDYELTLDDFKRRASFDDEIGAYSQPVDLHPATLDQTEACLKNFERLRHEPGESYSIPIRSLRPQGLRNVLMAGRCICTDRVMLGSLRTMPGCFIMGQAAGANAALAAQADGDVRGVETRKLQTTLRDLGAWLPNFAG